MRSLLYQIEEVEECQEDYGCASPSRQHFSLAQPRKITHQDDPKLRRLCRFLNRLLPTYPSTLVASPTSKLLQAVGHFAETGVFQTTGYEAADFGDIGQLPSGLHRLPPVHQEALAKALSADVFHVVQGSTSDDLHQCLAVVLELLSIKNQRALVCSESIPSLKGLLDKFSTTAQFRETKRRKGILRAKDLLSGSTPIKQTPRPSQPDQKPKALDSNAANTREPSLGPSKLENARIFFSTDASICDQLIEEACHRDSLFDVALVEDSSAVCCSAQTLMALASSKRIIIFRLENPAPPCCEPNMPPLTESLSVMILKHLETQSALRGLVVSTFGPQKYQEPAKMRIITKLNERTEGNRQSSKTRSSNENSRSKAIPSKLKADVKLPVNAAASASQSNIALNCLVFAFTQQIKERSPKQIKSKNNAIPVHVSETRKPALMPKSKVLRTAAVKPCHKFFNDDPAAPSIEGSHLPSALRSCLVNTSENWPASDSRGVHESLPDRFSRAIGSKVGLPFKSG